MLYTSPGFNLPGHPVAGPGNLTPSVPSLTGSHHMSSTWPAGVFTSGPSSPHLTIDQANSPYKLAAECQALDVKLAKQFQVLSGLEAMHRNSIQGMVHKTPTLGHSAWEATTLLSGGTGFLRTNMRSQPAAFTQKLMLLGRRCMK